jgi:hypothetical protein
MWKTGLISEAIWHRLMARGATPIAGAPSPPPTKGVDIAPPTSQGNDTSISLVPLQLVLVHVQPGRNVYEGSAQIGVVRESAQAYQAGALLENGARLVEIHADYVLLQKGDRSARLYLDVGAAGKAADKAMLMVGGAEAPSPAAKGTSREILTDYIRPSPVYEEANLVGYQVYPGAHSAPRVTMKQLNNTSWTKTRGGGTFYVTVLLFELLYCRILLKAAGASASGPTPISTHTYLVLLIAGAFLLVLLYFGWGSGDKKRPPEAIPVAKGNDVAQAFATRSILRNWIAPPISIFFIATVVWFGGTGGFLPPNARTSVVLLSISLLTLIFPVFRGYR